MPTLSDENIEELRRHFVVNCWMFFFHDANIYDSKIYFWIIHVKPEGIKLCQCEDGALWSTVGCFLSIRLYDLS